VDRVLPGSQRAPDGTLNNAAVWGGLGTRAASLGAGFFGGPLASIAVNRLGGAAINAGTDYYNNTGGRGQATPGDYANNAPAGYGGNSTNYTDYGSSPGFDSGATGVGTGYATIPNYGGQNYNMPNTYIPTMPAVQAQGPWAGLGTSTGNVFSGGSLGSWANGSNVQNNTAAAQAWGGKGSATQGNQWTGISGDAARSYFGGMSSGATDALQHEAMMAMKLQQQ